MGVMTLHDPETSASTAVDWPAVLGRLRRYALRLTRRADECDELVQQTIVMLLERQPQRAAHWGYARQTLTRLWIDQQRTFRRRALHWLRLAAGTGLLATPPAPTDSAENATLQSAIESLPPLQRACIVLRLIEDLEYPEIATTVGCSVTAVRANLHLARRRLRDQLEPES